MADVTFREGFIGGGISTIFISLGLSYFMCQFNYFICPIGTLRMPLKYA